MNRRDFIKAGAAVAVDGFANKLLPQSFAVESYHRVTLKECTAMSPQEMATVSPMLHKSFTYLEYAVSQIKDAELRKIGNDYLANPAHTLLTRYTSPSSRERLVSQLVPAKYLTPDITAQKLLSEADIPSQATPPV